MALIFLHGQHADELAAAIVEFRRVADFLRLGDATMVVATSPKWAMTAASIGVGLGEIVHALAKSRTVARVTTTAGTPRQSRAPTRPSGKGRWTRKEMRSAPRGRSHAREFGDASGGVGESRLRTDVGRT